MKKLYEINDELCQIKNVGKFICYKDDWITKEIKVQGDWEPELNNLFDKFITKTSNVIDIGAFIGTHTIKMAHNAKHVYAFEANFNTFRLLQANLLINDISNVSTFNNAVGNDNKVVDKMWHPTIPINYGAMRINKNEHFINDFVNVNINMIRLDDITLNENVDFIKIDVEGCEEEVLQGGIELIKKCKPIIIIENWENKPYETLLQLGYNYNKLSYCNELYIPNEELNFI